MDLADFMGFAGIIQNPFGNGRLAGVDMGDYADITYGIDFLFFHRLQPVVILKTNSMATIKRCQGKRTEPFLEGQKIKKGAT
jgi:hypothetical protein